MQDTSIEIGVKHPEITAFAEEAEMAAYFPSKDGDAFCQCASTYVLGLILAFLGWPTA